MIDHQVMGEGGKPEMIVVRHAETSRNPLLIVELKRPAKFNESGKAEVAEDIGTNIEARWNGTQYGTIYGLGGIGLKWMVYKMGRTEGPLPVQFWKEWQDEITSNASFAKFQEVAEFHCGKRPHDIVAISQPTRHCRVVPD